MYSNDRYSDKNKKFITLFEVGNLMFINKQEIHARYLIYVLENEKNKNHTGQTESPVRDLVGGMEERSETPKFRAAQSLHKGFGLAETISTAVGDR